MLTGGTALSEFYLKHRYSEDLDLFTRQPRDIGVDVEELRALLLARGLRLSVRSSGVQFVRAFVEDIQEGEVVKIELARDVPVRMAPPMEAQGCVVDSFEDIAVNKVSAILDRREPKDFVDLYFILKESSFTVDYLMERAKEKHANFESDEGRLLFAANLHDAGKLEMPPGLVKPVTMQDVQEILVPLAERIIERYRPRRSS